MKILKRYRAAIVALVLFGVFILVFPTYAPRAGATLLEQLKTMLLVLPPIFLLLGLLDVWVPRETLMKHMGPASGVKGAVIAFVLGSVAAGPLYGAFPIAAVLMKKGASFWNILIFIGAWSTTKIPMFLFELNALGARFAVGRLAHRHPRHHHHRTRRAGDHSEKEIERLYAAAESMD